jgi:hypothetical protein
MIDWDFYRPGIAKDRRKSPGSGVCPHRLPTGFRYGVIQGDDVNLQTVDHGTPQ